MAKKNDPADQPVISGNEPITAKTILAHAIDGTDLPSIDALDLPAWLDQFTDPETLRRATELVRVSAIGDVKDARHWAHQTEDAFLRSGVHGKPANHR